MSEHTPDRIIAGLEEALETEKLRSEFVAFQFGFNQFSDHYSVVAQFAAKKMQEVADILARSKGEV